MAILSLGGAVAGVAIGGGIHAAGRSHIDSLARLGAGIPSTINPKVQKLTTFDENNPEVINWPKLHIYEFIPAPNPEISKVAMRTIQGPSRILAEFPTLKKVVEGGGTGEGADILGRYLQAISRGDKIGFDKGTDYIKNIFGKPEDLPVWGRYELPIKDLKFIDVDTTSSWSTDGLYKGDLTAKMSRNVPVMPLWKADAFGHSGKNMKFSITLVNRDLKTAQMNRQILINMAQGMYWSQSDSTQVSPHIFKLFISESDKIPPDDPHSIGILKDADGNETGRNELLHYGIMWYMEWAALGLTVDYAGQIRDGLPEEYKIELNVKALVPDCLNTTVFGWDHRRSNAPELIKWLERPDPPPERSNADALHGGVLRGLADTHATPEERAALGDVPAGATFAGVVPQGAL